jgi:hypothetical protein
LKERLYDAGKGDKFNDFTGNIQPLKQYKILLGFEDDEIVDIDTKGFKGGKNTQAQDTSQINTEKNISSIKTGLLKKKPVNKKQEPFFNATGVHLNHRLSELQTYHSISGYKTTSALPPNRASKNLSLEPTINRFKAIKDDPVKSSVITQNDLKLTRPTTTIVNLQGRKPTEYVDLGQIVESEYNDDFAEHAHQKLAQIFPPKHDLQESEEDQYMGKINEFIKEAFEGKDYRVMID